MTAFGAGAARRSACRWFAAGARVLAVEADTRLASVFGERVAVPAGGRG